MELGRLWICSISVCPGYLCSVSQLEMWPIFVTSVSSRTAIQWLPVAHYSQRCLGFVLLICLLLDLHVCSFLDVHVFCFLPLLQSQMRWGMPQRVLDGAGLHWICATDRPTGLWWLKRLPPACRKSIHWGWVSMPKMLAHCRESGGKSQFCHVSQSLVSQHLQKDSKQHLSPLTFLYGRCRGLLCIRDFFWVGQRSTCCT